MKRHTVVALAIYIYLVSFWGLLVVAAFKAIHS